MQSPVYTVENECQDWYKCVRHCHPKAIRIENGHAAVIADAVVVCGGTTANIVTRELGAKVSMDLRRMREAGDLPPCGETEGIGLATEGVLTLARVRRVLETGADWVREAAA